MAEIYWYSRITSTKFVVKNIVPYNKTVRIFNYPVYQNTTRDLLMIPGVSEADIRHSLLKGDLYIKLKYKELAVVESNIDLLQFNNEQRTFLEINGVTEGLSVSGSMINSLPFSWKEEIPLLGVKDGANTTFFTPDKFLNGTFSTGDHFHITVQHNGRNLYENIDYTIGESDGPGTGYDTINLISFSPASDSLLFSRYAVKN